MARRALKVCSVPGCPALLPAGAGRCDECAREADHARGSARARGYDRAHETRFRRAVLAAHPVCQRCGTAWSKHADHWPVDRHTLVLRGEDPNDPRHGRGLCGRCHSIETANAQPGGWNASTR